MSAPAQSVSIERHGVFSIGPVRVVLNAVVLFGAYIGFQIAAMTVAHRVPAARHDEFVLIGFAALSMGMLAVYALLTRLVERRWPKELAFSPRLALTGVVLGAVFFVAVYVVLWALGNVRWQGFATDAALVLPLAIALGSAFGEEITFRGGIFRVLEDSFGSGLALVISAVAFGLIHAGNPGASAVSTAAIALESGVLLGAAYAATRNLWLPIGLHFGWNFTEGGIFGANVSGRAYHGLVHVSLNGPDTLTGGQFGPEASAVAVAISLAASLVFLVIAVRSGRWKPLAFRMRLA